MLAVTGSALLGWIAWCDWSRRHIPNASVGLLVLLAAAGGWLSGTTPGWPAALAILGVGSLLFAMRICGAGDVKMLAATVLLFPGREFDLLLGAGLMGGCLALVYRVLEACRRRDRTSLPYGVAIAASGLIEFFAS